MSALGILSLISFFDPSRKMNEMMEIMEYNATDFDKIVTVSKLNVKLNRISFLLMWCSKIDVLNQTKLLNYYP